MLPPSSSATPHPHTTCLPGRTSAAAGPAVAILFTERTREPHHIVPLTALEAGLKGLDLASVANPIFLASAEPETGKSAVALGLLSQLSRTLGRVGVFRPIVRHHDKPDYVLQTLIGHGGASTKHEDAAGVTYADVHHNQDESLTKILAKFYAVSADSDAVIIVGSDYTGVSHATELEFNARIAANIGAPMVLVMRGHREDQHMCDVLTVSVTEVEKEHAHVNAVVVNAADPDRLDEIRDVAQQCLRRHPVYRGRDRLPSVIVLPADPILGAPTMGELMVGINGRLISGDERLLSQEATGMLIAGMTLPHVLPRLYDNAAVVVPGDRFEIMLGVMVAHRGCRSSPPRWTPTRPGRRYTASRES
ncbi:MAG: hypothetical protein CSB46_08380 [Micrococcales bacterium]|nr:MAG: hypothetical protein CSB46_08380 [Micrococcales bacterium]